MDKLHQLVEQARALMAQYGEIDEDDVSYKADEQRAMLEQEGYGLLCQLVDLLD